jgi:peroxiredoxin
MPSSPQINHATLREALQSATVLQSLRNPDQQVTLLERSQQQPVLLVLLRHMGCTFCREAMADVAAQRRAIEARGVAIVLVHMSPPQYAQRTFATYPGLADIEHVSDPAKRLYDAMELRRGTFTQLFGWRSWWRGFRAGFVDGHLVGKLVGDGFQMPGAFLLRNGQVLHAYRHAHASDRPDYCQLAAEA